MGTDRFGHLPTEPVRATLFVHLSGRNGKDKVGVSNDRDGAEGAADLGNTLPGSEVDPSDPATDRSGRSSGPTSDAAEDAGRAADGQESAIGGTPIPSAGSTPIPSAGSTPTRAAGSSPFSPDTADAVSTPLAGEDPGGDLGDGDPRTDDPSTDDLEDGDLPADDADSGVDEADGSLAAVGAAAGSARAAARRSAVRSGVTEKKGRATVARDDSADRGPNILSRISRYLREVVAELRKVIWPSRNQMVTYTLVVIVFVVFMVALVYALDLVFAKGVLAIFG